jgi:hypothetical protein
MEDQLHLHQARPWAAAFRFMTVLGISAPASAKAQTVCPGLHAWKSGGGAPTGSGAARLRPTTGANDRTPAG